MNEIITKNKSQMNLIFKYSIIYSINKHLIPNLSELGQNLKVSSKTQQFK